jgi:ATP-dependent RNA helicase DDX31/DBP7
LIKHDQCAVRRVRRLFPVPGSAAKLQVRKKFFGKTSAKHADIFWKVTAKSDVPPCIAHWSGTIPCRCGVDIAEKLKRMVDDCILLNFSLPDGPINAPLVFKGGRWKDRLKAKRTAQQRRPQEQAKSSTNIPEELLERPSKRQKQDETHISRSKPTISSKPPQEVVSSLFSYNPTPTLPISQPLIQDEPPTKPSNAPLVDGLDTFTTLGLSTTLATHLLTKLNLKAPTAIQKATISQLIKEDVDAFIQAETGSGKTLAYLLPIVQRIMELSKRHNRDEQEGDDSAKVHRDSGLFSIILAPTRELCKQISTVLDTLLRCAHWIVAGTVIGGEKKKSEKARLRKGLNILVATPGRLVDHLSNTEALDVRNVRWLVLDEGDRLMELGFEEEIKDIVSRLDERARIPRQSAIPGLPTRRTTILCSATMKMNVQRLGEISLKDAILIKANPADSNLPNDSYSAQKDTSFSAPAQLKQSYILCPPKQRLVTLTALLKRTFVRKGSVNKAIVFLSCADSVDFHFALFTRQASATIPPSDLQSSSSETDQTSPPPKPPLTLPTVSPTPSLTSPNNPNLTIHKLHGSLPQHLRTSTLSSFHHSPNPSILLCTDVASRGLDLPNIDLVIEYDPPFSSDDHLHRIGRTARAGRDGRSVIFLMPGPEEGYVDILKSSYAEKIGTVIGSRAEDVLRKGFAINIVNKGESTQGWEDRATEFQLEVERWVIEDAKAGEMARKAYISHVRAYATHVLKERGMFDVKALHLGHLAKAFGLRERPGKFGRGDTSGKGRRTAAKTAVGRKRPRQGDEEESETAAVTGNQDAARRMRKAMEGQMKGASEFNIG